MAIKLPVDTDTIPNPLHQYASYTYSWSLWWLQVDDYNRLMDSMSAQDAMTWKPVSHNSFVVAQDGGRYPERRQPGTLGLNYHIQNVQFDSVIAPNKTTKSSNMIRGSMTIVEPYGVTLIDTLVAASWNGSTYNNYTDNPYMLQLEFRGYDDNGEQIPQTDSDVVTYTKRFPIRILTMKVEVTTRGTEYKIDFVPAGGQALLAGNFNSTPEIFTITAGTVKEFFKELEEKFTVFNNNLIRKNNATIADGIFFKIDPEIANSKIVNESKLSLSKSNPKVKNIQLNKNTFTIPMGTPILDIINNVMSHSEFLIQKQLKLEEGAYENSASLDQTAIFNSFKTTTKVEYGGIDINGQRQAPAIDLRTNRYSKIVTYNIMQYAMWSARHPAVNSFYVNSNPYTQKYYNYLYTGQNTDIIDLKINFDSTYYTAIMAFTTAKAAEDSTEDTEHELQQLAGPSPVSINPAIISKIHPQLASIPTVTPIQYRFLTNDVNVTRNMNILDRPAAQVAADVLKSIYTAQNQEMLSLTMTIVGDPTLIKQDDWLYIPDPTVAAEFNDWSISSFDYAQAHGHSPMDRGQVVVHVNINSPVDMDLDQPDGNQGLAFPQPRYSQSLFSGQYIIVQINNRFANGKFEQVLNLVRIMNDEAPNAYNQATNTGARRESSPDPVQIGIENDTELVLTNPSRPLGDYDPDNVSNEPLPIADTNIPIDRESLLPWTVNVNADPRQ
jgi:hypothetical protein